MDYRVLRPGQLSQVFIGAASGGQPELIFESDEMLVEAPNWSRDGSTLYLNGDGRLWALQVDVARAALRPLEFEALPALNNDHVVHPDGVHILMSAADGHIYAGALTGGAVRRVSPDDGLWHFLHGISPDGERLAYVQLAGFDEPGRLAVIPAAGGEVTLVDTGPGHLDGPEWSPDGEWIYLNTETFTLAPGHAQLARIPDVGGSVERLVASGTVDWFPHLSPDGLLASYITFPAETQGHPADLDVEVRIVSTGDWATPLVRFPVFGGQGTLNVNSWSPDSTRIAFVAYPLGD
jgi:TolB protein